MSERQKERHDLEVGQPSYPLVSVYSLLPPVSHPRQERNEVSLGKGLGKTQTLAAGRFAAPGPILAPPTSARAGWKAILDLLLTACVPRQSSSKGKGKLAVTQTETHIYRSVPLTTTKDYRNRPQISPLHGKPNSPAGLHLAQDHSPMTGSHEPLFCT